MEESRRYEASKYIVSGTGFVLNTIGLIALYKTGLTFRLRDLSQALAGPDIPVVCLFYFAVVGFLFLMLHFPLRYFSGYYLEHRYGLSRQSRRDWLMDSLKAAFVTSVVGIGAFETMYLLLRYAPDRWWIYASIAFAIFGVVLANLAPVLILPLFFRFNPVENPELNRRMNNLARRVNARICGMFEWSLGDKTRKANAAVVGLGKTRRIIVSDTMLRSFSAEEIEVIMAHELCHHVKGHIWWSIALQSALTFASFFAIDRVLHRFNAFDGPGDVANFPVIALTGIAVLVLTLPIVNGFSRWMERDADRFAIEATGDALAFVSSMDKLAHLNLANSSPNRVLAFIFHSHPSIEERIKLAADRVGQVA